MANYSDRAIKKFELENVDELREILQYFIVELGRTL
jgi:hypothetical protein